MSTLAEAKDLLRQGRIDDAERMFERLLGQSPLDIEALNAVALAALRKSDARRALGLLEQAVALQPAESMSHYHLGRARAANGDVQGSLVSYGTAVRLRPPFHVARLHFAATLDALGERIQAPIQYLRALQDAQSQGQWHDPATTPRGLQAMVGRAVTCVRDAGKAMCAQLLEPLRAKYGAASLLRIDQAVRIYVREVEPVYPDLRQRPTFFYLPGLPTAPYLDRALFPWIASMESQTAAIRTELQALLPAERGRERVFTSDEIESVNLRGHGSAPTWNGYYFFRYGERREENHQACPATSAALAGVDLCHIREHGPEVLYSVFTPGTHLLPHRGVTNTRLVAHLPLIVPPDCALNVGGEVHAWQEGRVVVFDDTYEHEAWNRSDRVRVVMLMDIWNPHLAEVERAAVADLVAAIGDFRKRVEQG